MFNCKNNINYDEKNVFSDNTFLVIDNRKYYNFSIDDVIDVFYNITINDYDSIFENELLFSLKKLHDSYNLKIVLYVFYENDDGTFNLSKFPSKYKKEFKKNSNWLKLSFHSKNKFTNYENKELIELNRDYNLVINEIRRFADNDSLSNTIRLQNFQGDKKLLEKKFWSFKNYYIFLTADDNRQSYNLNKNEILVLSNNKFVKNKNIYFYKTDYRLESEECLENFDNLLFNDNDYNLILFTHEYEFFKYKEKLEKILKKLKKEDYISAFVKIGF